MKKSKPAEPDLGQCVATAHDDTVQCPRRAVTIVYECEISLPMCGQHRRIAYQLPVGHRYR